VQEAVEVDHVTWHGGLLDSTYDKRRDRQLRRLGVHVTRVTDDDVLHRLDATIADLAAILRPPRRAG
jgi:very-short-patch-repair endonuclease